MGTLKMEYKNFLEILLTYQKFQRQTSELNDMGFDFFEGKYDLYPTVEAMFQSALNVLFTKEGVEWIEWFIYENEWGTKDWSEYKSYEDREQLTNPKNTYGAFNENGEPICYSHESLWDHVKQYLK